MKPFISPTTGRPITRQRWGQIQHPERNRARHALGRAVKQGRIAHPSTLTCSDCGRTANQYDHYLGYAKEHQLEVQAVCTACHGLREAARRTHCRRGHSYEEYGTISANGARSCRACATTQIRPGKYKEASVHAAVILRESDLDAIAALLFAGFGGTRTSVVQNAIQFAFENQREAVARAAEAAATAPIEYAS